MLAASGTVYLVMSSNPPEVIPTQDACQWPVACERVVVDPYIEKHNLQP